MTIISSALIATALAVSYCGILSIIGHHVARHLNRKRDRA